jgi:putative transposase
MPRRALNKAGGIVFHVLNRSARRSRLFFEPADYLEFEGVLAVALRKFNVRLLAYCVMPNHWHLVLWPEADDLPRFMHWLTLIHARQWHDSKGSNGQGYVYQDRYRAIPVQGDNHLLTLIRYVERNPLRAGLVERAENWRWSSLWYGRSNCHQIHLSDWPIVKPSDWIAVVNQTPKSDDDAAVQKAIRQRRPFGEGEWSEVTARAAGLSVRGRGRPPLRKT